MRCPRCKLINPPGSQRCDCRYSFINGKVELASSVVCGAGINALIESRAIYGADPEPFAGWVLRGAGILLLAISLAGIFYVNPFLAFVPGSVGLVAGYLLCEASRRLVPNGVTLLQSAAGPPILYLRRFKYDKISGPRFAQGLPIGLAERRYIVPLGSAQSPVIGQPLEETAP